MLRIAIIACVAACSPMIYPDQCEEGVAPDAACHAQKRPKDSPELLQAAALAEAFMARHPAQSLEWNWEEGVLLFALTELHRVSGDEALLDYVAAYLKHHRDQGFRVETSDQCPAAASAATLAAARDDAEARALVERVNRYLASEARRTADGGINHMGVLELIDPSLWLDSLFMFGEVWLRQAELLGNPEALALFDEQFGIFTERLQRESGLYTHAADWIIEQTPGLFWARGNGWVATAGFDALRLHRLAGHREPEHERSMGRLAAALMARQDAETGLWWTLLSEPGEGYVETSGSALIAYGLARGWRYGYLGDEALPVLAKARAGLLAKIRQDEGGPVVTDISGPTTAAARDDYLAVRLHDDLSFGVGAMILAMIELAGLETSP